MLSSSPSSVLESIGGGLESDFGSEVVDLHDSGTLFAELIENFDDSDMPRSHTVTSAEEIVNVTSDSDDNEIIDYFTSEQNNLPYVNKGEKETDKIKKCVVVLSKMDTVTGTCRTSSLSLSSSSPSPTMRDPYVTTPCMSKNAITARENRQKKKMYVKDVEEKCETLSKENELLKKNVRDSSSEVKSMKNEISYLRSVIANEGSLAALLKNIHNTPGMKFSSSLEKSVAGTKCGAKRCHDDSNNNENDPVYINNIQGFSKSAKLSTTQPDRQYVGPPTPRASPDLNPQTTGAHIESDENDIQRPARTF